MPPSIGPATPEMINDCSGMTDQTERKVNSTVLCSLLHECQSLDGDGEATATNGVGNSSRRVRELTSVLLRGKVKGVSHRSLQTGGAPFPKFPSPGRATDMPEHI